MSDFGDLLKQWERQKSQSGQKNRQAIDEKKSSWQKSLESYLPDRPKDGEDDSGEPQASTIAQRRQHLTQDELDLHGFNVESALVELKSFLDSRRRQGLKKVRIIHGRGLHSGKEGVLKVQVRSWLDRQRGMKWEVCPPAEGGQGAVWVWLGN